MKQPRGSRPAPLAGKQRARESSIPLWPPGRQPAGAATSLPSLAGTPPGKRIPELAHNLARGGEAALELWPAGRRSAAAAVLLAALMQRASQGVVSQGRLGLLLLPLLRLLLLPRLGLLLRQRRLERLCHAAVPAGSAGLRAARSSAALGRVGAQPCVILHRVNDLQ